MMRSLVVAFSILLLLGLPAPARASNYGVFLGSHLGYGHEGDPGGDTFQNRSVGTLDLQAMPGYRFYGKSILAGLLFDLRLLSQLSQASKTDIGDFGGKGLSIGPGVVFDFVFGKLLLSWDWRDRQSINQPDATLKGSGFHILFGYRVTPLYTFDIEYVVSKYNSLSDQTSERDLSSNAVSQKNVGVGISVSF